MPSEPPAIGPTTSTRGVRPTGRRSQCSASAASSVEATADGAWTTMCGDMARSRASLLLSVRDSTLTSGMRLTTDRRSRASSPEVSTARASTAAATRTPRANSASRTYPPPTPSTTTLPAETAATAVAAAETGSRRLSSARPLQSRISAPVRAGIVEIPASGAAPIASSAKSVVETARFCASQPLIGRHRPTGVSTSGSPGAPAERQSSTRWRRRRPPHCRKRGRSARAPHGPPPRDDYRRDSHCGTSRVRRAGWDAGRDSQGGWTWLRFRSSATSRRRTLRRI